MRPFLLLLDKVLRNARRGVFLRLAVHTPVGMASNALAGFLAGLWACSGSRPLSLVSAFWIQAIAKNTQGRSPIVQLSKVAPCVFI